MKLHGNVPPKTGTLYRRELKIFSKLEDEAYLQVIRSSFGFLDYLGPYSTMRIAVNSPHATLSQPLSPVMHETR